MRIALFALLATLLQAANPSLAAIHCVATPGELQDALASASASPEADVIRARTGTYALTAALFYSPTAATDLEVSGGWNAACDTQSPGAASTVLDGQNATRLFGMNSSAIASVRFENLTATRGESETGGAGMFISTAGDLTFDGVRFVDNIHTGALGYGGALHVPLSRDLRILNSAFHGNESVAGGGASLGGCATARIEGTRFENNRHHPAPNGILAGSALRFMPESSAACTSIDIVNTQFVDQIEGPLAIQTGGAVRLVGVSISGTTFLARGGNELSPRIACGAIVANPTLANARGSVELVDVEADGGDVPASYCFGLEANGTQTDPSSILVRDSQFFGHTSGVFDRIGAASCTIADTILIGNHGGTAIVSWCPTLTLERNQFIGNTAGSEPSIAVLQTFLQAATIRDNLFSGNASTLAGANADGGVLRFQLTCESPCNTATNADIAVTGNTFVRNRGAGRGGALAFVSNFDQQPVLSLQNNLFWGNASTLVGRDVWFNNDADDNFSATPMLVTNNGFDTAEGFQRKLPTGPIPSSNLVIPDPQFADPETEDFRLGTDSAARDVGTTFANRIGNSDNSGDARVVGADPDFGALEANGAIAVVDSQPTANDDAFTVDAGTPFASSVAGNDLVGDLTNTWTLALDATQASVVVQPNGSFTYAVPATAFGADSFNYSLCDQDGDCDSATVALTVIPEAPVARDDSYTIQNTANFVDHVGTNDTQAKGVHTYERISPILTTPQNVVLELYVDIDGKFTVIPPSELDGLYVGTVTTSYRVCDAENDCAVGNITVQVQGAPPPQDPHIFGSGFEQ